ncbi:GIY-YIG nuclease family protein [Mycoplasmopsis gallopavonis]|uniref:Excinuclease ABC subunit C n=1 Tax=Mycoplasmopsis gallopavonis TaxID=76629 RepID=A0A449AZF0_9BACT|nr:GIY-YIG nuclease family protein [Mycoplasmopsis gallopavonis]RIV16412.1 excinuclease ABC subunit C [Mycoplasmopsis gallopavonis]VEU72864.1 Excinuclease ABC subunit C [Mycoplasmopsis gallopavonis]
MIQTSLQEKLKNLPKKPGVYLWKNQENQVIYIGKAKNLFNRMNQYFKGSINSYKTNKMVAEIRDFDIFICKSDKEAYLLEKNYIEIYKPSYNLELTDDKRYPYLVLKLTDKLEIQTSFRINKQSKTNFYYGPFPKGSSARELSNILQRLFLYKDGLLIQRASFHEWETKFQNAVELLKLRDNKFIELLETKMAQAASLLNFELALEYKKSIAVLKGMREQQIVELINFKNIDVFSFIIIESTVLVFAILYRYGVQIAHLKYNFENLGLPEEIINNFLERFYQNNEFPDQIILDNKYQTFNFDETFGKKIVFPKVGILKKILDQAQTNNQLNLELFYNEIILRSARDKQIQTELEKVLNHGQKINNIFLFDNSNFNNTHPIGVAIAYQNLQKNKSL